MCIAWVRAAVHVAEDLQCWTHNVLINCSIKHSKPDFIVKALHGCTTGNKAQECGREISRKKSLQPQALNCR